MQTDSMVVGSSFCDWMFVLLSATLIAQGIQYVQCAESRFSWPPALRPVLEAAVGIANSAVAVVAAAFSSPRSLPRTVRRRHEREREKRAARALKRSNSAKISVNRAGAKQTAAVGAQPLPPPVCNHDDEGSHSQAAPKACSKANSNIKATAGAQVTTCYRYFANYVSSTDNNLLCHEANEAGPKPSQHAALCDAPLDAPYDHDGAHKPVVVHPPPQRDEPTDQKSNSAAASPSTAAHDEDKWQIEDQSRGVFVRWVLANAVLSAGIVSFGGVAQGSQSTGGWAPSADGAGGKGRSSRGSGNNKKGPGKRKRGQDDGRDEKKRGGPGPFHRHDDEGEWDGRFLACPYYKMDPHRYSRCWAKYELKRFADVKQHLIRCHKVKEYYCSRCCLVEFEDHDAWELHSQSCNEPNTALRPENFTVDEIEHLAYAPRGATDERKYYWAWETFFFKHPAPESPYVPDYLTETRSILSPDFQAALQTALLSPPPAINIERAEGEDMTAWLSRLSDYLGRRMLELASQAEHPRRLRFPPSDAHADAHAPPPHANHLHAHPHANRPAVALQQPQQPPPQPQPHPPPQPQPVAPAHAPAVAGLFPTVAHPLQVPPSLLPHHQSSLPHRVQRSASAAARAASAAASPSGVGTTISPSLLNMGMGMNMYYQNSHHQPHPRQRSHRPARPSPIPPLDQEEIPIDPNLSYLDPPPPPPPAPQGPPGNTNQPANADLSDDDNDDDDDFDYGAYFSLP
ncbi:unnamed protein product [Clonostachys solani]|uniref:C2H2-type domain-containing protein n=1 Tax=Clonostachys solani TaxID=160281 RepID=A0A9N9YWD0_9HYPO|nr:unnamed protein product [Clonostachys solani]